MSRPASDVEKSVDNEGARFRRVRRALDFTQDQVVAEVQRAGLQMSAPSLSKWEKGKSTLPNGLSAADVFEALERLGAEATA